MTDLEKELKASLKWSVAEAIKIYPDWRNDLGKKHEYLQIMGNKLKSNPDFAIKRGVTQSELNQTVEKIISWIMSDFLLDAGEMIFPG